MRSFRLKLVSVIVFVVLVSTAMLFLISYQRTKSSMSVQTEENCRIIADKYAQEMTAWVNTSATILDSLATEITVSGIYDEGYEAFHKSLAENYGRLNKDNTIYDIYFTYPDNTMACASDFVPDGTVDYAHDRDWFTEAARTGELFYSPSPYLDSDSGKPVVTWRRTATRSWWTGIWEWSPIPTRHTRLTTFRTAQWRLKAHPTVKWFPGSVPDPAGWYMCGTMTG